MRRALWSAAVFTLMAWAFGVYASAAPPARSAEPHLALTTQHEPPARARPLVLTGPADMRRLFPAQYAAYQDPANPSTRGWALLVGINDYVTAEDNTGARPDAESLRSVLLNAGWRDDHIMLLTDRDATAAHIVAGIRWLAAHTNKDSVVVFAYSGHERPVYGDADPEKRNVALWTTDDSNLVDERLGEELSHVRAQRMWIFIATCRAAGFDDAGTIAPGRVITYSSHEDEFSYDAPQIAHSVFGYMLVELGMVERSADLNLDGRITVQEAFRWADPGVVYVTRGMQHPVMIDRLRAPFYLQLSV